MKMKRMLCGADKIRRIALRIYHLCRAPMLCCLLFLLASVAGYGQETQTQEESADKSGSSLVVYSFFVNIVPETFRFPLIGFFNYAKGQHSGLEMGFVNWNTGAFSGLQLGYINTVGGAEKGVQIGFVNTAVADASGIQIGFVNTVARSVTGLQLGFVNTAVSGAKGSQIGFVNTSAGTMRGVQFGFVNYADSIEGGVPVGFVSIVRHGGYQALAVYTSEAAPLNIAVKLGVPKLYTAFIGAYDPSETGIDAIGVGLGLGTIISFSHLYLNPELRSLNFLLSGDNKFTTFSLNAGWNITSRISLTVGPSVTWVRRAEDDGHKGFAGFDIATINDTNRLLFGCSAGVVLRLSKE